MTPGGTSGLAMITDEWNGAVQVETEHGSGQTARQWAAAHLAQLRHKLDTVLPAGGATDGIVHHHTSAGVDHPIETTRGSMSPEQWADVHYASVASSLAHYYPDV